MKRIILIIMVAALALGSAFAQLKEGDNPDVKSLPIGDARAFGLEGAMTAVNDDMNSLFFNPAGLAFLRRGYFNVNLGGWTSTNTNSLELFFSSIAYDPDNMSYYDANAIQPSVVLGGKGWGLALTADYYYYVPLVWDKDIAENREMTVPVSRRIGAVGGLGFNLGPIAVGANMKYYTYSDYDISYNANIDNVDFSALIPQFLVGSGINFKDPRYEMNVGVGAVVTLGILNIGAYYDNMMPFINAMVNKESYSFDGYLSDCFKTMSVGASFMPSNDKFSREKMAVDLLASVDLKNLGDNENRQLCAGAEFGFDLWNILVATARVGYKQALPTETFSFQEMAAAFTPDNGELSVGATAKVAMAKVDLSVQVPVDLIANELYGTAADWGWVKGNATVSLCF